MDKSISIADEVSNISALVLQYFKHGHALDYKEHTTLLDLGYQLENGKVYSKNIENTTWPTIHILFADKFTQKYVWYLDIGNSGNAYNIGKTFNSFPEVLEWSNTKGIELVNSYLQGN